MNDPNAMTLSSVDHDGMPNVRIVLLKSWDEKGFVYYTNLESAKGVEVLGSGKAALNFHWKSVRRQIRIRGLTESVDDAEADAYFESRPRLSRIGAWASQQSRELQSREALMDKVATIEARYPGDDIPRPPHWSGTRVKPLYIEFWREADFRLHDRLVFTRSNPDSGWTRQRLYP
ncbi:MAG: pyridoxamine 5'-phosphate oxidase [Pseudomonadota bacterium]